MAEHDISEDGPEGLDAIQGLWEKLNAHHAGVSPHFTGRFERLTFAKRKALLLEKAVGGAVRVFMAKDGENPAGYCVAAMLDKERGEIESIFVDPSFRSRGFGEALMRAALRWLDARGAKEKSVGVIYGNEAAHPFYRRFGFLPLRTVLRQIPDGERP